MNKFLLRALRKFGLLKRITLYPKVNIEGSIFRIPVMNGIGIDNYLGISELWMTEILKILVDDKNLFVDIGINLGQSLIKLRAVSRTVPYVGFEPNPLCVYYTSELIRINDFKETEIYPVGITDSTGVLKLNLYSDTGHDSSASIIENFRSPESVKKTINVPVFNISELEFYKNRNIGIIKIDVEGAELEVLKSLSEILKTERPYVLIEILPAYSEKNTLRIGRQKEISELLGQLDYGIFRIKKTDNSFQGLDKIKSFDIHSDINLSEYIFCPKEQAEELLKVLYDRT